MKITTVIGARPQFIKASYLSRKFLDSNISERILHTGQHYDKNMSDVFFEELKIPRPALNLGVSGQSHGAQTGQMLEAIENDLLINRPNAMLVYGDTNSTLGGALAAKKLHIPVIHVEAGLRSFDSRMPEEVNRILTDHISELLLCPTATSIENLNKEGITSGVHLCGDVMHPVLIDLVPIAKRMSNIRERLNLLDDKYFLATIHRAENTDNHEVLKKLMNLLSSFEHKVIIPMHPRTKSSLEKIGWKNSNKNLKIIDPVGYLDMISLTEGSSIVLTDSGGLQKESVWLSKPCVTLRETTEWTETLESGWNILAGSDIEQISKAVYRFEKEPLPEPMRVDMLSAEKIIMLIEQLYLDK